MIVCLLTAFLSLLPVHSSFGADEAPLKLTVGYIYKLRCEGRLLISAIGDEALLRLEPLPRDSGCGAIVKPLGPTGITNILLETSSGSVSRLVQVSNPIPGNPPGRLEHFLRSRTQDSTAAERNP